MLRSYLNRSSKAFVAERKTSHEVCPSLPPADASNNAAKHSQSARRGRACPVPGWIPSRFL